MSDDELTALKQRHGITTDYIRRNDPSRKWLATHGHKTQYAPTEREAVLELIEWLSI